MEPNSIHPERLIHISEVLLREEDRHNSAVQVHNELNNEATIQNALTAALKHELSDILLDYLALEPLYVTSNPLPREVASHIKLVFSFANLIHHSRLSIGL